MAKHLRYWDFDRDAQLTCDRCGWTGPARGNEEFYEQVLDVDCSGCGLMLLIVPWPTGDETREAAAAGNPRAVAELPKVEAREARLERADRLELKEPGQLPELAGPSLRIAWDFIERDGETWTVLRHEGDELWVELAFYEGYERFAEVLEILRERYGERLVALEPTRDSWLYLYGDRLWTVDAVTRLNASLGT